MGVGTSGEAPATAAAPPRGGMAMGADGRGSAMGEAPAQRVTGLCSQLAGAGGRQRAGGLFSCSPSSSSLSCADQESPSGCHCCCSCGLPCLAADREAS